MTSALSTAIDRNQAIDLSERMRRIAGRWVMIRGGGNCARYLIDPDYRAEVDADVAAWRAEWFAKLDAEIARNRKYSEDC